MSRVILSKYPDGSDRVVVGWDHPAQGAFWKLRASADEVAAAEKWLDEHEDQYMVDAETTNEMIEIAETGVKAGDGMWPGIPLDQLKQTMPEDLRPLLTEEIYALLYEHAEDPESGRISIDCSERSAH